MDNLATINKKQTSSSVRILQSRCLGNLGRMIDINDDLDLIVLELNAKENYGLQPIAQLRINVYNPMFEINSFAETLQSMTHSDLSWSQDISLKAYKQQWTLAVLESIEQSLMSESGYIFSIRPQEVLRDLLNPEPVEVPLYDTISGVPFCKTSLTLILL